MRGLTSRQVTSGDQVRSQWQSPGNILDLLLLVGSDVIRTALAQLTGSYHLPTPVIFSFGWVAYAFSALVSAYSDGRLLPEPDVSCYVVRVGSQTVFENDSWLIGRLLRDFENGYWMDEAVKRAVLEMREQWLQTRDLRDGPKPIRLGLAVSFYRASRSKRPGTIRPGVAFYMGYVAIIVQLAVAAIPWILYRGSNYIIFAITVGGTTLALVTASLPHFRYEKFGARFNSEQSFAVFRGSGSQHVLVIQSNGIGVNLLDLATGAARRSRIVDIDRLDLEKLALRASITLATVLWIVLLVTVDGLESNTWFLIAVGAIGSAHAVCVASISQSPEQVGVPMEFTGRCIAEDKVMRTLVRAELYMPGLGLSLRDSFFPEDLQPAEQDFWMQAEIVARARQPRVDNELSVLKNLAQTLYPGLPVE